MHKTGSLRRGHADVRDGDVVGMEPGPARHLVQQLGGGLVRREERAVDLEFVEQNGDLVATAAFGCSKISHHELLAVEFGAAVDEGRDIVRDQEAAELIRVEDAPGLVLPQRIERGRRRLGPVEDEFMMGRIGQR